MTAGRSLLEDLRVRGVRLWAESDKLKFDAPRGVLTDEYKTLLVQNKSELLALLTRPPIGSITRPMPVRGHTMPTGCWDDCCGELVLVGEGSLYQCGQCGSYFELLAPEQDPEPWVKPPVRYQLVNSKTIYKLKSFALRATPITRKANDETIGEQH